MGDENLRKADPKKHTILIVDDTTANLETLYGYFESLGFEIMMARSGEAALKRVAYKKPDIILLDVVMPGMDGFEICRRLKGNDETGQIPIIFMTALTDTVHKVHGFKAGAADYITKPLQIEEVLARVQTHLTLRDLQAELEAQNKRLQAEILERQETAVALRQANDQLELRVARRTAELKRANESLEIEVQERREAEAESRKLAIELAQRVQSRTDELAALYEVTALAGDSSLDLEAILERALASVINAVPAKKGLVYLLSEEATTLIAQVGFAGLEPARLVGDRTAAWIAAHNRPLVHEETAAAEFDFPLEPGFIGVPIRSNGDVKGALSLIHAADERPASDPNLKSTLLALADHLGIVIGSIQLRKMAEQAATLEERSRLARELHDSVTQLMYSINLFAKAGADAYRLDNIPQGERYLRRLQDTARQALKELRLLLFELRPPQLEQEGIVGALQLRLDAVEGRAGVKTQLLVNGEVNLPRDYEEELYAIAQEALNNALKHANAAAVAIHLLVSKSGIELQIVDDGMGFEQRPNPPRGGMGLLTMRERSEKIGGALSIDTLPEIGTTVRLTVDLPARTEE